MKRATPFLLLIAFSLLVGPGCARVEKQKKTQGLEAAANAYGKSIRWAYYETAYGYLHPDKIKEVPEHLENVRVTSYDVVQPPVMVNEEQTRAEQVAQIEYVLRDRQIVRKLSDRQDWRFDEETETWWLHSDIPAFR